MAKRTRNLFSLACCCLLLLNSICAFAQGESSDSTAIDTTAATGLEASTPIDGEYNAPEHPVIYNSAKPTEARWQQLSADSAYNYRDKREYIPKKEPPPQDPGWLKAIIAVLQFLSSTTGKVILWSALALIIGYVIYRIVKGQGGGLFAAKDRAVQEEEAVLSEEGLLEADWEGRMQQAINEGDARLAIRFGYLRVLQLLQQHNYIDYRPEKTNAEYYRELANRPQRQPFRAVTRQYEWAWYGNMPAGREALEAYLNTFRQLKQSLSNA